MFRQDCSEISGFSVGGDRFKDSGCAICSAFHHVEQVTGRFYSPQKVGQMCIDMLASGVIDKDFTVQSWNELFAFLGVPVATRFEGPDYQCKDNEIEILKLQKPDFTHFVAGDGKGNYSYDSLGRRPAQKQYHVAEKRIMRIL